MADNTLEPKDTDTDIEIQPATNFDMLSMALLNVHMPRLKKAQTCLAELTIKQANVLAGMEKQTRNFSEHALKSTAELIEIISIYKPKLVAIKKRMLSVHQRTQALKKRAIFIKDFKAKELDEKLRKQRQEEALIGDNEQNPVPGLFTI